MKGIEDFYGPNAAYVLELYERFLQDPGSADPATRKVFEQWKPEEAGLEPPALAEKTSAPVEKIRGAANLAQSLRTYGHLAAHLDPLGSQPRSDPWLDLAFHHITNVDLKSLPAAVIGGPLIEQSPGSYSNALQAYQALEQIYTGTRGYEYGHIRDPQEREWLWSTAELGLYRAPKDPYDPVQLLDRLTQVEALERFLHRIFPGKTRFSIEGVDMLVPMLDDLVGCAADSDICSVLVGMAHRGRLNVLAHLLGKPLATILAEFKDPQHPQTRDELGWTGDVKYHKGAHRAVRGGEQVKLVIYMPPNPSHLEHIDPVLAGMARAADSKVDQPGPPQLFPDAALPVAIHGDASFPGQGVVAETLNLSRLPGYSIGGTVHIITNNQLGYTTNPKDSRSTHYASDLAKGFTIPVIHVNADDPPACLEAARTAFAYRQKFRKDFLIDLVGYRRYGHNEGDEPAFTQPVMYQEIEKHPTVRQVWAGKLVEEGKVAPGLPEEQLQRSMNEMQAVLAELQAEKEIQEPQLEPPPPGAARQVKTAVDIDRLKILNEHLLNLPEGFCPHRKLERAMERRRHAFDHPEERSIDWAAAEELALASILSEGIAIRLTGEDVERGTFSQRHAVFHHVEDGSTFIPLQHLAEARASFEVRNSPLSENAAIGFEFGYDILSPKTLVIWEAQYGDFINTAQAMIDEFVLSGRAKWEQTPSLVLLLPHAHEGAGPDHTSARPERFLQLADQNNLRLANCTTAAQYFHLLMRQALLLETDPLPLIVLTPKSLLRHPLVASRPVDLSAGGWMPVIDDERARRQTDQVRRLLFCSGKIYVDLASVEGLENRADVAIIRLEQLYPFPSQEVQQVMDAYPGIEEIVWVQEEPENMGAWSFVQPFLLELIGDRWPLQYIGREASSSPAEGSFSWHTANQKEILTQALERSKVGENR